MEAEDFAGKVKELQAQKGCYTVKESKRTVNGKEFTVKEHVRCDGSGSTVVSTEPVEDAVLDDVLSQAIERNGGYPMSQTSMGEDSILYANIMGEVGRGNEELADHLKAQMYSDEFKEYYGDWQNDPENASKILDENGEPKVFYHGTTHRFDSFTKDRGNIENDFGVGIYMSSEYDDVEANYNEIGPDLKSRIELRADRLENEDGFEDMSYDDRLEVATKELGGGEEITMSIMPAIKKPFVVGGDNETYLDYQFDEDSYEESGSLIDFADAMDSVANEYYNVDMDVLRGDIFAVPETSASDLMQRLRKSEGLAYATDENGNPANNEVLRAAIERSGYDGIVDNTVWNKFGGGREYGTPMEGITEETTHIIAFNPNSVKSLYNDGSFRVNSPNIYGTKISKIIAGTKYEGMIIAEIVSTREGRAFLREQGYFD